MREFSFGIPQKIWAGENMTAKAAQLLKAAGLKNILVISDRMLDKAGLTGRLLDALEDAGLSASVFLDVEANPSVETVERAAAAYRKCHAEGIAALGGGSPMDVAKAAAILVKYGGSIRDYEGVGKVPGPVVPFLAMPMTAGTGSEATAFAVVTDYGKNGEKKDSGYKFTIGSEYVLPAWAVLDDRMITSLPGRVAASTGMDAIVHAVESYLSKAATPFSEALSEKAMELLGGHIRAFVADRSDEGHARAMMIGSNLAGIAFSHARLGDAHAMAHPVSGFFHAAHGEANAALLPAVLDFNEPVCMEKYGRIYRLLTGDKETAYEKGMLSRLFRELNDALGIGFTLKDLGVKESAIPDMAKDAMKSGNVAVNPRETTLEDIIRMYKDSM